MTRWLIDGNNVMGSRPDGWWNDRPAAQVRLVQQVAEWCRTLPDDLVILVFDGRPVVAAAELAGGNLRVEFATATGRNAADRRNVELTAESDGDDDGDTTVVVTADRGLIARLADDTGQIGPRSFLHQISARADELAEARRLGEV